MGIIGIFVAMSLLNFSRYQYKSGQSEAKLALSAIYGVQRSFYSEYSAFVGSLDAIGYAPEGQRRYCNVGFASGYSGTINGYAGGYGNNNFTTLFNPYTCTNSTPAMVTQFTGDTQSFTVSASDCIRNGQANFDRWSITDQKILSNTALIL